VPADDRVGPRLRRPVHCARVIVSPAFDARGPAAPHSAEAHATGAESSHFHAGGSERGEADVAGACARGFASRPKAEGTRRISNIAVTGAASAALQSHMSETGISAITNLARACKQK